VTIESLRERFDVLASEVAGFGPRSVPPGLRRDHILAAATLAFVADGFDGASMERIANAAGVTKPVVYNLFGSKEDLLAAVIDRESEHMSIASGTAVAASGETTLRAGLRAYLDYERDRRAIWGPILGSTHLRPVADAALRLRDDLVGLIAGSLQHGYDELGISCDPREVEALSHIIIGSSSAVAGWWRDHPELDVDAIADLLTATLGPALQSVRGDRSVADVFE
jgi:AcrR family transcriptional regulator